MVNSKYKNNLEKVGRLLTKIFTKLLKKGQDTKENNKQNRIHDPYAAEISKMRQEFLQEMENRLVTRVLPLAKTDAQKSFVLDIYNDLIDFYEKYFDKIVLAAKNHADLYEGYRKSLEKEKAKESNWWKLLAIENTINEDIATLSLRDEASQEERNIREKLKAVKPGNLSEKLTYALDDYIYFFSPDRLYSNIIRGSRFKLLLYFPVNDNTHPIVQRMNAIKSIFYSPVATAAIGGIPLGGTPIVPLPPHLFGHEDEYTIYAPETLGFFNNIKTIYHNKPPSQYIPKADIDKILFHVDPEWARIALQWALEGPGSLHPSVIKELKENPGANPKTPPLPPYPQLQQRK
jgi:hypothetical protein